MGAAGFLIVEAEETRVGVLHFFRSIVEWIRGVHLCGDGHLHFGREDGAVGSFDAFRSYLKYF